MIDTFITEKNNMFIFNGYELEIYIPNSYFDTNMAVFNGNIINTFGVLYYRILNNSNKVVTDGFLNIPTTIALRLSDFETREENILGNETGETVPYTVVTYLKGQELFSSIINEDASRLEFFMNLMLKGKLDPNIPYNEVISVWLKNMEYAGKNLGVPLVILELIISKIYRYKKNPNKTFAKVIGSDPKTSPTNYVCFNARTIAAHNSTFSAMTFEDMDSMITTSLNSTTSNKEEEESPIEKIIKM